MPPTLQKPAQWLWTPALLEPAGRSLARGLQIMMPFFELQGTATYEYISGVKCAVPSGWTWVSNSRGGGLYKTSADTTMSIPDTMGRFDHEPHTVFVVGDKASTANAAQALISTGQWSSAGYLKRGWTLQAEVYNNTGKVGLDRFSSTAASNIASSINTPLAETVIGFKIDTSRYLTFCVDGVVDPYGVVQAISPAQDDVVIGGNTVPGDLSQFLYSAIYVWNRALTDAEMQMLSVDPFILLRRDMAIPRILTAGGTTQIITIGTAAELTAAQPAAAMKPILELVSTATETDTAQPATPVKPITLPVTPTIETDTAQPAIASKPINGAISTTTETDTAQPATPVKPILLPVTPTTEVDTSPPVAAVKPIVASLGATSEIDTAVAVSAIQASVYPVLAASEVDTSHPVAVVKPITVTITEATETDTSQPVAVVKPITATVGTASETDAPQPVAAVKPIVVTASFASESDAAIAVAALKSNVLPIGTVVETDTAQPVPAAKPILVVVAYVSESETGQTIAVVYGTFAVRWREGSVKTQTTGAALVAAHMSGGLSATYAEGDIA